MLVIATVVATASAAIGTIVSFHLDGATGACIVLTQASFFIAAFLFAPKHGVLRKRGADAGLMRYFSTRLQPAASRRSCGRKRPL